jgi:hypothetical protein
MKKLSDTYKKLGIAFTFPIEIKDENGNETYFEDSDGNWYRQEYDENNNESYYENSDGHWSRWEYDEKDNLTYYEGGDGTKKGSCDGKVISNWMVRSIN